MTTPSISAAPAAPPHSKLEDAHALLMGSAFAAFGLVMLKSAGLVTGGIAGLALTLSYLTGWPIGPLFVTLNLPFFLLAQRRLGWVFTLKSIVTMLSLAALTFCIPNWLKLEGVNPVFAAVFGGSIIGMGVLSLARHRASVGGIGILALYLQERRGWSAGLTSMAFDTMIVGCALAFVTPTRFAFSALSAIALNLVMLAYHRPGRYAGQ